MKYVDIIVPCFNESEALPIFFRETTSVMSSISSYQFRFIFIDDGSTDDTRITLKAFSEQYHNVRFIAFSRNFGKEAAMYAGLKNSTGDLVLIMDADMQHPPFLIKDMLTGIEEGYDCCGAYRATRSGDPKLRILFTRNFYRFINKISDVHMPDGAGDFRMMTRPMVNAILSMSEVQRFSKGIFSWVGFQTKWIPFENVERAAGETKWSFGNLFAYAINGITAFSTVPLRFASIIGIIVSGSAFIYFIYTAIKTLLLGKDLPGYASTICLILFIGGVIILSCGILGEYIAKIYMEVKKRPIYIVKESNIMKEGGDNKNGI